MIKRDSDKGLTEEDANHRLSSQLALKKKLPYADIILDNADDAKKTLEEQIGKVVERWKKSQEQGWGRFKTLIQWIVPPVGLLMAVWAVWSRTNRVARNIKDFESKARQE